MSVPHAFVPSDESRPGIFICIRLLQCPIPPWGGDMMCIGKMRGKRTQRAHTCAPSSTRGCETLFLTARRRDVWPPPPMRRALAGWAGELRFRGRVWVGGCCLLLGCVVEDGEGWGGGCSGETFSGDGGGCDEWTPAVTLFWGCTGGAVAIEHSPTCPVLGTPHPPPSVVISPV